MNGDQVAVLLTVLGLGLWAATFLGTLFWPILLSYPVLCLAAFLILRDHVTGRTRMVAGLAAVFIPIFVILNLGLTVGAFGRRLGELELLFAPEVWMLSLILLPVIAIATGLFLRTTGVGRLASGVAVVSAVAFPVLAETVAGEGLVLAVSLVLVTLGAGMVGLMRGPQASMQ